MTKRKIWQQLKVGLSYLAEHLYFLLAFVLNLKLNRLLIYNRGIRKTFINKGLLDKMIITIIPKIIGEGIPLFAEKPKETNWKLIEAKSFDTGVVNLTYEKAD